MEDLESRIKSLEEVIIIQDSLNSNVLKSLKSTASTIRTVLELYQSMKIEMEVLRSEILPRN